MADKILKTRVKLLKKSYADWQLIANTFVPIEGEMCIVEVPATATVPASILFKVGNGTSTYAELPYASALASDVYAWAKKENLEWVDLSEEFKNDLGDFIDEHYTHDNTLYQIVSDGDYKWKLQKSEDGGTTWVDATGVIDISTLANQLENLAEIAKTGNVNDLIQTDGDVLILDCNI
jgi:hypothetical protein